MAVQKPELIQWDDSNAAWVELDHSFTKEEREWHLWYDELEDRTYSESNYAKAINKMQRNPSFVAEKITLHKNGYVISAKGYVNGFSLTLRK